MPQCKDSLQMQRTIENLQCDVNNCIEVIQLLNTKLTKAYEIMKVSFNSTQPSTIQGHQDQLVKVKSLLAENQHIQNPFLPLSSILKGK